MKNEIKPIRAEAEYDQALAEVERLWESKAGTPDGDRFEVLVTLIEAYEDEHYPMHGVRPLASTYERMNRRFARGV